MSPAGNYGPARAGRWGHARALLQLLVGALVFVLALAHCSDGTGSTGGASGAELNVGVPCVLEVERDPRFEGFQVTEETIETGAAACGGGVCLANHFQGRVTCPLGQPEAGDPSGGRAYCDPNGAKCPSGQSCVAATTLAPACTPPAPGAPDPCAGAPGTHCDPNEKRCVCTPGGAVPEGFVCAKAAPGDATSPALLQQFVCHVPGNCQQDDRSENFSSTHDRLAFNRDEAGNPKDCCVPGTDTPVVAPTCGQCSPSSRRNAEQAVYCSCRCGPPEGEAAKAGDTFCACPAGFTCSEIRKDLGIGDTHLAGKYCIKEGSVFQGDALSCGGVEGHFDPARCHGSQAL